jgi:hypothetical protein
LDIEHPLDAALTPALHCLGSDASADSMEAGDRLDLTLYWRATSAPAADYRLQLALVSDEERIRVAEDLPLGRPDHPTSAWREGEIVRSPHSLRIPASVPPGRYAIEGTLLDAEGEAAAAPVSVGEIAIEATDRLFVLPSIDHPLGVNFEGQIALLGYSSGVEQLEGGQTLPVTLYWQALQGMQTSYKVSVQLVGPQGVLTQQDAIPGAWTRPTTGWVPKEIVVDRYELQAPAELPGESYALIVGLYDESTLQRLQAYDGEGNPIGDHVVLRQFE